jgi:hypothetical protein
MRAILLLCAVVVSSSACGCKSDPLIAAAGGSTSGSEGSSSSSSSGTTTSHPDPCPTPCVGAGCCLLSRSRGTPGDSVAGTGIDADPTTGDLVVVGTYTGTPDLGTGPLPPAYSILSPDWGASFVARYDSEGHLRWIKGIVGFSAASVRFSGSDLFLVGDVSGAVDLGCGALPQSALDHPAAAKLAGSDGSCIWSASVAGGLPGQQLFTSGATPDTAGDLVVSGSVFTGAGFVTKLRGTDGSPLWEHDLAGAGARHPFYDSAVAVDASGAVYMGGILLAPMSFAGSTLVPASFQDAILLKYDGDGNEVWAQHWGSTIAMTTAWTAGVVVGGDQRVWITGMYETGITLGAHSFDASAMYGAFVAGLAPDGSLAAATAFTSGPDTNRVYLAVDRTGAPVVAFPFISSVLLGGTTLTPQASGGLFVAKLDPASLAPVWSQPFTDEYSDEEISFALRADPCGDLLLTGTFQGPIDIGCGAMNVVGTSDLWFGRLGP